MILQLVTALGALLGTGCGLLAESFFASASQIILPFTAGKDTFLSSFLIVPLNFISFSRLVHFCRWIFDLNSSIK